MIAIVQVIFHIAVIVLFTCTSWLLLTEVELLLPVLKICQNNVRVNGTVKFSWRWLSDNQYVIML